MANRSYAFVMDRLNEAEVEAGADARQVAEIVATRNMLHVAFNSYSGTYEVAAALIALVACRFASHPDYVADWPSPY